MSEVIHDIIEAASREDENEKRKYLGMSSIGDKCSRRLWYQFRGFTPSRSDGQTKMIFDLGNRIEDAIIKWLMSAGYLVNERQKEFGALNGFFCGHWDGCISGLSLGLTPKVLEIKSANSKRFTAIKEQGIAEITPSYYKQVQCYMGYSGLDETYFIVMNKNNCELYDEIIKFDRDMFIKLEEKAKSIIDVNIEPTKEENEECEYCQYRMLCNSESGYVQTTKTCGTCHYCSTSYGGFYCKNRSCTIKNWGLFCESWVYKFSPQFPRKEIDLKYTADLVPF